MVMSAYQSHTALHCDDTSSSQVDRDVAIETAVAISINGTTHAVMMCSPTDLRDFAIGFAGGGRDGEPVAAVEGRHGGGPIGLGFAFHLDGDFLGGWVGGIAFAGGEGQGGGAGPEGGGDGIANAEVDAEVGGAVGGAGGNDVDAGGVAAAF